jgi:hypothetical protein
VWIANSFGDGSSPFPFDANTVQELDASTGRQLAIFHVINPQTVVVVDADDTIVVSMQAASGGTLVSRVAAGAIQPIATVTNPLSTALTPPDPIASCDGVLYLSTAAANAPAPTNATVVRVDLSSGAISTVATIPNSAGEASLSCNDQDVFVALDGDPGGLFRIGEGARTIAGPWGGRADHVIATDHEVWTLTNSSTSAGLLVCYASQTGQACGTRLALPLENTSYLVTATGASVFWVLAGNELLRIVPS